MISGFHLLVGRKVRCKTHFLNIPQGTTGTIIDTYKPYNPMDAEMGLRGLMVRWDLKKPINDGFSPREIEYLEFLNQTDPCVKPSL